jgi:acetyltransferase-like isoleucine patch superfamily enzyme
MPASAMDTSSPQTQARMALKIEHQLSARAINVEETEKDKMIRGELYRPFDLQLVEERDRCKRALWRFNNACNPHYGLSSKEQNRLLREILIPPSGSVANSPSGVAVPHSSGSIGQGAVVESPFNCHYGYNIQIGEDVMIHQNCLFVDDCGISIGAHSWIGPNVTLLSSMAHSSMQERKGSQSRYQGRPVIIEEDCYLGAGCTIYPGVHLNRGAYVAPGEVVKTDIVAYGFQGYKPSYM